MESWNMAAYIYCMMCACVFVIWQTNQSIQVLNQSPCTGIALTSAFLAVRITMFITLCFVCAIHAPGHILIHIRVLSILHTLTHQVVSNGWNEINPRANFTRSMHDFFRPPNIYGTAIMPLRSFGNILI